MEEISEFYSRNEFSKTLKSFCSFIIIIIFESSTRIYHWHSLAVEMQSLTGMSNNAQLTQIIMLTIW